jgi:hypothetical protein
MRNIGACGGDGGALRGRHVQFERIENGGYSSVVELQLLRNRHGKRTASQLPLAGRFDDVPSHAKIRPVAFDAACDQEIRAVSSGVFGAGFDVSTLMNDPMSAHGLLMIQDRLKRVDASLEVTSAPGNGTQTVIEIPIEQQEG